MGVRASLWWLALACAAGARELDPAACGARFDVQRDKIIRTEESRDMGARYLSELDVGARHECLRLCCETDACDVFVYEEKSPGSCYLFNCGPPEDFRCKFTTHGNFSSGVLALSRRLAELQDQQRLQHREREQDSLRGLAGTTSTSTTPAPAPPAPPGPAPLAPPAPPPPPPAPALRQDPPPGRCSRYQFECRRGGECIAVYNACDGVPQCADGSDEAPELGCPAPAPAAPAPAPTAPPPPSPAPQPRTHPPPLPPLKNMQVLGEAAEGAEEAAEGGARERWPHRLLQAQPPHRYNVGVGEGSRGPHIFSHKGGLLQAEAPQFAPFEPPAAAPPAPWARRIWGPQSGGGGDWGGLEGGGGGAWGEADPRRAWPVPQPRPDPELPLYVPAKTMPELPPAYDDERHTLRDSPKKGLGLPRPPPPPPPPPQPSAAPPPTPPPPPPPAPAASHNHDKQSHEVSAGVGGGGAAAVTAQFAAADERDGLSDHPPAAILLLVLGVGMTGVLGALAGCRRARRRLRRGRSLAHDADYLVNGMYL